jgi:hypothetical protein
MSSAPGMAPPPGVQQANASQANRPSGLPHNFQAPPNMPNINFNAPVIRLGTAQQKPGTLNAGGRKDSDSPVPGGGRPGLGMDRGVEQTRAAMRESMQALVLPTNEEKLRTVFIGKIPEAVGGDEGIERILNAVGKLRRWDSSSSVLPESKGLKFGFAQFEDLESLAQAFELLQNLELPKKRHTNVHAKSEDAEAIEKVPLKVTVDGSSLKYIESHKESRDDGAAESRLASAKLALEEVIQDIFFPRQAAAVDGDGDVAMGNGNGLAENVEVVNIPLAQEDELADIPAEMREVVAAEIAAFRDRSNRRDMERLRREEEMEEMERQRNGAPRLSRLDSPPPARANSIPLGPRGALNAPSGPRGQNGNGRSVSFVNGGTSNADLSIHRDDDDTSASDEDSFLREVAKQRSDEDKLYLEAERKWVNRERSRAAALDRERDRDKQETDNLERRREEQLERERNWDDEREASRKSHLYYRDHGAWVRKRASERADEEARDAEDRRLEDEERRREEEDMEQAKGLADSFLDRQSREIEQQQPAAAAAAPQPFKLSLGAASRAVAQRAAPQRRTIAEVEAFLDDEENEQTSKRTLIPIQFEPTSAAASMSEEEVSKASRALAQEIPSEKHGLWNWDVQWDFLDDSIIREKLRPFVEKKIMEYLGVQEDMLVEVVEEHLRKHGKPGELVDDLSEVSCRPPLVEVLAISG